MKKHPTLKSVENELSLSIILATILVFILSVAGHFIIQKKYTDAASEAARLQLESALNIYTSSLISRVGIIISATEFIDFIRSGEGTRAILKKKFVELMGRIPKQDVLGWEILDKHDETIFSFGKVTDNNLSMPLCYIGDVLNAKYGSCNGRVVLYLSAANIISSLQSINPGITQCNTCPLIDKLPSIDADKYGAISSISLGIEMHTENNLVYFYLLESISVIAILAISFWTRIRVKYVFHHYIINPILGISSGIGKNEYNTSSVEEIVDLRYQRDLLKVRTFAEEVQNRKLANEIHDMFGSLLLMLKWNVAKLEKNNDHDSVAGVIANVDELIAITNNFLETLRPEILDTLGLVKSVRLIINEWQSDNEACKYKEDIDIDESLIPEVISHAVYRILQEALANIVKHSNASETHIGMHIDDCDMTNPFLITIISDNGIGFDYSNKNYNAGHGLRSMKERAVSLGGSFNIYSDNTSGTRITIRIPIGSD